MPPEKNETCGACGGCQFSMNDGFKYCDRCGTLFENFEELEQEEGGIKENVGRAKVRVKQTGDKVKRVAPVNVPGPQLMREALEKRSNFLNHQAVRKEELDIPHESTPDYLYRLSLRLFSFTQMLAKSGHILVKELDFEPRLQPTILATFQRYLSHCRVAFCQSEQCGSDDQLRFVAMMENIHYEEQEREEKRRKKLARRGKGAKALSTSAAAWTLLTTGNITENLDLTSESEEESEEGEEDALGNTTHENVNESLEKLELTQRNTQLTEAETVDVNDITIGFVRKVTTALSKEALRRAAQLLLNLEVLVAVLHSALICSGYRNVFVSDVVRWIREDRFRISRRAIRLMRKSHPERLKSRQVEMNSAIDYAEPFLRFPLYEIVRTCTIFNQSINLSDELMKQDFDTMAARLISNLNLPTKFLSSVLLLESIVPCDVAPNLLRQVDVKMGYNCGQLAALLPKLNYSGFMSSFGRKERVKLEADACDEVLLSVDTKIMAYILLVFRFAYDSDSASSSSPTHATSQLFDIDTWLHQLEMRMKCWQGHDMSMVLRSSCPVPEMSIDPPFGPNYTYSGSVIQRHRRQVGFQKCIPSQMSFNSTATLPTVFDVRHNRFKTERRQMEAMMSPLKFQRIVLDKEMEMDPKFFENIDPESKKNFFTSFTTFESCTGADSFEECFPLASRYSVHKRPDWIQNCTARKSALGAKDGPYRFYLSNKLCEDLLGVATPSFSRRFQFLLESLSLLIGEDQKAVYAAFVMLETHLITGEKIQLIRDNIIKSEPITIDCQKFHSSTHHVPCTLRIISEKLVDRIEDVRYFLVARATPDHKELSTPDDMYLADSRNQEIREILSSDDARRVRKKIRKLCYNFEQMFSILALKFW